MIPLLFATSLNRHPHTWDLICDFPLLLQEIARVERSDVKMELICPCVSSSTRADLLVLREGASEPPRAPALLLLAPHLLGARPGPRVAALRPQRTLPGAVHAHAAGRARAPGVSARRGATRRVTRGTCAVLSMAVVSSGVFFGQDLL